jgi:hypothetical protein
LIVHAAEDRKLADYASAVPEVERKPLAGRIEKRNAKAAFAVT